MPYATPDVETFRREGGTFMLSAKDVLVGDRVRVAGYTKDDGWCTVTSIVETHTHQGDETRAILVTYDDGEPWLFERACGPRGGQAIMFVVDTPTLRQRLAEHLAGTTPGDLEDLYGRDLGRVLDALRQEDPFPRL